MVILDGELEAAYSDVDQLAGVAAGLTLKRWRQSVKECRARWRI